MRWVIGFSAFIFIVSPAAFAADKADISGQWTKQDGKTRMQISRDVNGIFEGKICWLKEPNFPPDDAEPNKPKHDRKNPDKSLQNRPIIGLVIMKGFKFAQAAGLTASLRH